MLLLRERKKERKKGGHIGDLSGFYIHIFVAVYKWKVRSGFYCTLGLQNNDIHISHVGNRISEVSVSLFGSVCLAD